MASPEGAASDIPVAPITPIDDYFSFIARIHGKQLEAVAGKVKNPTSKPASTQDPSTSS